MPAVSRDSLQVTFTYTEAQQVATDVTIHLCSATSRLNNRVKAICTGGNANSMRVMFTGVAGRV